MTERETRLIRIHGIVQGVGYRNWAQHQAGQLRLSGWVRNRRADKSVEALISGHPDDVQRFIAACHQGPSAAKVTAVHNTIGAFEDTAGFEIRETL